MKVEFEVSPRLIAMTALCGFVGLMALVSAFPDSYALWPRTSSDWAAWVQAIGSVAAICVAIAVAYYQRKLDSTRTQAEALLHAVTMSERLSALYKSLSSFADESENVFLKLPHALSVTEFLQRSNSIRYPEIAGQLGLAPVGMGYLRSASAAAREVAELHRNIGAFVEGWNASDSESWVGLSSISVCASNAATKCHAARMQLENYIGTHGLYRID